MRSLTLLNLGLIFLGGGLPPPRVFNGIALSQNWTFVTRTMKHLLEHKIHHKQGYEETTQSSLNIGYRRYYHGVSDI